MVRRVRINKPLIIGGALLTAWLAQVVPPWWHTHGQTVLGVGFAVLSTVLAAATVVFAVAARRRRPPRATTVDAASRLVGGDGSQLEILTTQLLGDAGIQAQRTGGSGDRGVDVRGLTDDGLMIIVSCKAYTKPVGPDMVRDLIGTRHNQAAHLAVLVAPNGVTEQAGQEAADGGVLVLTIADIEAAMSGQTPLITEGDLDAIRRTLHELEAKGGTPR